jgi:biopolymer transport protein ExbD
MLILVDAKGKLYFGIDGQENRMALLVKMGSEYNINFSQPELKEFSLINSFGVPMDQMKSFLQLKQSERDNLANISGIPYDSINNEFKNWVKYAREISGDFRIAIKADQATAYPVIKKLMGTLQDLKENRYNLITSLESAAELEIKQ